LLSIKKYFLGNFENALAYLQQIVAAVMSGWLNIRVLTLVKIFDRARNLGKQSQRVSSIYKKTFTFIRKTWPGCQVVYFQNGRKKYQHRPYIARPSKNLPKSGLLV
jgi:hypothetical protein